uniref:ATP-dependent DNA ligase family profile domain-containing protein n=1 Tax=Arcella intermedia TaxID=1963864 RepID=A0A6B2LE43_9EUKA
MDPSGWWMSEKLDGARAFWDHQSKVLWSRQGKQFSVPDFFIDKFPSVNLDGELWSQRGKFQEILGVLNSKDPERWKTLKFCVFDSPLHETVIEKRIEYLEKLFSSVESPYLSYLSLTKCTGKEHLLQFLNEIDGLGGEGVIIREPGSLYEVGRSNTLLKAKKYEDMEVKFIGITTKPNYHAYICMTPQGKRCIVNTTLSDWKHPPPKDTVITVRYSGYWASGSPRYPYFHRLRPDLSWEDVLNNFQTQ